MDLAERRTAERSIAEARRDARRDYVRYSEESAKADHAYRLTKARSYVQYRGQGETGEGSRIRAEADAAEDRMRRDISASLAKAALLRVDEAERESVVVRDLHRTSERIDGLAA